MGIIRTPKRKGPLMGRILMADIDGTVAGCREGIEAWNR